MGLKKKGKVFGNVGSEMKKDKQKMSVFLGFSVANTSSMNEQEVFSSVPPF